jgi:hypothetical protein
VCSRLRVRRARHEVPYGIALFAGRVCRTCAARPYPRKLRNGTRTTRWRATCPAHHTRPPSEPCSKVNPVQSSRLFDLDPALASASPRTRSVREAAPVSGAVDALDAAERFLAEHVERHGDIAVLQAVLYLADRAGLAPSAAIEELEIDRRRFPRSAHSLDRVRHLVELGPDEWPSGFWPRFLAENFAGDR